MTRPALALTALLALLAGAPALPAQEAVKSWIPKLQSGKAAEERIAQAYLARAGKDALPALERLAAGADAPTRRRLKETVALMLLNRGEPPDLAAYPKLAALCDADVRKAKEWAGPLASAREYDSGEHGLMPPGSRPSLSPPRKALFDVMQFHGLAVPAARELCAGRTAAARLYGAELLMRLGAVGEIPALEKLTKDDAAIRISHGDYAERTTVGKQSGVWLKTLRGYEKPQDPKHGPCFEAERYLTWLEYFERGPAARAEDVNGRAKMLNRLRQEAKTLEATSWDDYWRRARPVLEKAWNQPPAPPKVDLRPEFAKAEGHDPSQFAE